MMPPPFVEKTESPSSRPMLRTATATIEGRDGHLTRTGTTDLGGAMRRDVIDPYVGVRCGVHDGGQS